MTSARSISVRGWLGLAACAILCVAAWFVAHRWKPFTLPPEHDLAALSAERDQLRGNEDPIRDGLIVQVEASRATAWTGQALAGLPEKLGPGWRCDWQPDDATPRAQVVRCDPRLDDWPDYLAFVTRWSQTPGVTVESVEITAEGGRHDRRLIRVSVRLRFLREGAPSRDASRAVPSHGPARVAPADGPAAPRKVGPVTSLRRPGTSAEPPAPGSASASFRPDPPGSQAGAQPQPKPTTL